MSTAAEILQRRAAEARAHKAAREAAAKRNRDLMPGTAANVDELRELFGDGIKLKWSIEGGRTVGNVPYEFAKDGV